MSTTRIPPAERAPYRLRTYGGVAQVLASDDALVFTFHPDVKLDRIEDTLAKLNNGWTRK